MNPLLSSSSHTQQGVAIIEALIAILIFSIGVLGIVGMQANMVKNVTDSEFRSEANYVAQQLIGAMWADSSPATNLNNFTGGTFPLTLPNGDKITSDLPNGMIALNQINVTQDANGAVNGGTFLITVGWTAPGEIPLDITGPCQMAVAHCFSTTATISGS